MFPIDPSAIPKLPTRKALVIIDFQSDFLDNHGALHVTKPEGFVDRTLRLASHFRKTGHVVWVCSEFARSRPVASESILTSDDPILPGTATDPRRSGKLQSSADVDSEAFLTQGGAACVRSPSGSQVPPRIKETFGPRDITFIKSHYSAFKSGQLLHLLRGRLITELYVCGSLGNVGVYATTVDAAMYGYGITIVGDCCGFISASRQQSAIQAMVEATGCDIVRSNEIQGDSPGNSPGDTQTDLSSVADARPQVRASVATPGTKQDLHEKLAALKLTGHQPFRENTVMSASTAGGMPLEVDPDAQPVLGVKNGSTGNRSFSNILPPADKSKRQKATKAVNEKKPGICPIPPVAAKNGEASSSKHSDAGGPAAPGIPQAANEIESTCELTRPADKDVISITNEAVEDTWATQATEAGVLCEGDTRVFYNVLPPQIEAGIYNKLKNEVKWQRMSHQGGEVPRLVAVQGSVAEDGSMPVYRHPSDEAPPLLPFSPSVALIRAEAEKHLGHPLNHVLIQFYRDGTDYISEHSDKTLDIVKGSYIANVSLGAERTMVFRTKRSDINPPSPESHGSCPPSVGGRRRIQRARLPHNSLCRVGLSTNMRWLHSIRQDKRMDKDKSESELAFGGGRISLTFRHIGTFIDRDNAFIWGQGATSKDRATARPVINGQSDEMVAMLRAFGTENHSSDYDWNEHYGKGFDVLHMSSSPRFFYCSDAIINSRIRLALAEHNVKYAKGSVVAPTTGEEGAGHATSAAAMVKFIDNDEAKTQVQGDLAILLYLDAVYGQRESISPGRDRAGKARIYARLQQGLALLDRWRAVNSDSPDSGMADVRSMRMELSTWEAYAAEAAFIAGPSPTLADFAFLPVLHDIISLLGLGVLEKLAALKAYYTTSLERKGAADILASTEAVSTGAWKGLGNSSNTGPAQKDPM